MLIQLYFIQDKSISNKFLKDSDICCSNLLFDVQIKKRCPTVKLERDPRGLNTLHISSHRIEEDRKRLHSCKFLEYFFILKMKTKHLFILDFVFELITFYVPLFQINLKLLIPFEWRKLFPQISNQTFSLLIPLNLEKLYFLIKPKVHNLKKEFL